MACVSARNIVCVCTLLVVAAGVGGMDQAPPIKIKPQAEGKVRHIHAHHSPQQTCCQRPNTHGSPGCVDTSDHPVCLLVVL